MELIYEDKFENAVKKIKKANLENKKIIFSSSNDELNRKILEKQKIYLLLLNQANRKDFQKQRNSGFNQVLAKIAKKNKIRIGINLDEIIEKNRKERIHILSRIEQNIKICNKYKIEMKFISRKYKRDIYDLKSLGLILGMSTEITKKIELIDIK
jgi:ribonuclease P/MRP protein subunit RPP1